MTISIFAKLTTIYSFKTKETNISRKLSPALEYVIDKHGVMNITPASLEKIDAMVKIIDRDIQTATDAKSHCRWNTANVQVDMFEKKNDKITYESEMSMSFEDLPGLIDFRKFVITFKSSDLTSIANHMYSNKANQKNNFDPTVQSPVKIPAMIRLSGVFYFDLEGSNDIAFETNLQLEEDILGHGKIAKVSADEYQQLLSAINKAIQNSKQTELSQGWLFVELFPFAKNSHSTTAQLSEVVYINNNKKTLEWLESYVNGWMLRLMLPGNPPDLTKHQANSNKLLLTDNHAESAKQPLLFKLRSSKEQGSEQPEEIAHTGIIASMCKTLFPCLRG